MLVLLKTHSNFFFEKYNSLLMMENPRIEEENIIKDIRNLFRLKKELNYTAIKDIRNPFRLKKENKAIKDRIPRDIKNLF